ncbi:MAG: FAD/NAD(P)-binding oxidoreductase [Spirochaetes bacterium GWD1_27_9]|nr:MAG: FAD/NAD(P)-binding oxidoreductase [Spirochaetes bacterium GWB1_27_13]OHD24433.1 MAG: FAD/NAD(P)-binding oxidoreductase [Spirochaetes bacterium GWC1_27_15]OHD36920.1 MAG: FAD/NAD(P)-binding oxidoreductase [Spirochaetes bacterium GWD1_27_9]
MKYDVAIIGAGVSGSSIARKLSSYKLDVALLDKECDVSFGTSKANSGIIHAGFHSNKKYLKSRLEVLGNSMFDRLQTELGFPFKRVGILVVAFKEEDLKTIETLYSQGVENGVPYIQICGRDRIMELEPKLNSDVIGGLYAPTGGIIEPYRFVFSLVESAQKNGVKLHLNFKVEKTVFENDYHTIYSQNGEKITTKYVINAAGVYADEISKLFGGEDFNIIPRKGEEYLLDKNSAGFPQKVIFPVPAKNSKGILVIPTVEGTMMVGPTAKEITDKEDLSTSSDELETIFQFAKRLVPAISEKDIITQFAGIRPSLETNDFYIEHSKKAKNFIQVAGIQSPGLTASPAIAEYVKDLLKALNCSLEEKKDFDPYIEHIPRIRNYSIYEVDELVTKNNQYGNIVCRCENISEAEIVEAIKRGHTTIDGIKFFTRAGMGRCQGGFCSYKILKIISRETGLGIEEITKRGGESFVIKGRL